MCATLKQLASLKAPPKVSVAGCKLGHLKLTAWIGLACNTAEMLHARSGTDRTCLLQVLVCTHFGEVLDETFLPRVRARLVSSGYCSYRVRRSSISSLLY